MSASANVVDKLYSSDSSFGELGIAHHARGTVYGKGSAVVYSHGPDGNKFLNPVLEDLFAKIVRRDMKVVDMGCGSANEAIRLAQLGAKVFCVDFQESMVDEGRRKVEERGLEDRVTLECADASNLSRFSEVDESELALSILVGCNLPKSVFESYFTEMGRVVRGGGRAVIVLPSSLEQVFTKGEVSREEAIKEIEEILETLSDAPTPEEIEEKLRTLTNVNSATFVMEGTRLVLVKDLEQISDGQQIWRKLPDLVIPNFYWSDRAYREAFRIAGFKEVRRHAPCFESSVRRRGYNLSMDPTEKLGPTYERYPIFTTIELARKG